MHLKLSSAKWRPFCTRGDELKGSHLFQHQDEHYIEDVCGSLCRLVARHVGNECIMMDYNEKCVFIIYVHRSRRLSGFSAEICYCQNIQAQTRWLTFCKRHIQWHFLERKCLYFDSNFTEVCSQECTWWWAILDSGNGLAPPMDPDILRTNDVPVQWCIHYNDVIMGAIASQITSLTIVYSTVYSDADPRKHQSPASLAFVRRTGEFPAQMASNAENVSIWWRHHAHALSGLTELIISGPYSWLPDEIKRFTTHAVLP